MTKMTLVRPLMTNLEITVSADYAVSACSPLLLAHKSSFPLIVSGGSWPLDRHLP